MRLLLIALLLFAIPCYALEKDYSIPFCESEHGQAEYRLSDGTRVDCLTETHAIEVQFAKQWAESIGQALFYAAMTDRKPGIALIIKKGDQKYLKRLHTVADKYGINVWLIPRGTRD